MGTNVDKERFIVARAARVRAHYLSFPEDIEDEQEAEKRWGQVQA